MWGKYYDQDIIGLVQKRRNSIANAVQLSLSCTYTLICCLYTFWSDMLLDASKIYIFVVSMVAES